MLSPQNRLLAALPAADFDRLRSTLTVAKMAHKDAVYAVNGPIDSVYFPRSGVISIVVVLADGTCSEVSVVGREGMLGVPATFGADRSPHRSFCQVPGECWRMPAAAFQAELKRAGPFHQVVQRYTQAFYFQVAQSTACNHHHSIGSRCARWFLMTRDRVDTDDFPITQEFLAMMLGVRRPSVSIAASGLQDAGLVRYSRGRVEVVDRAGLEKAACECYHAVRAYFDEVLPSEHTAKRD